MRTQRSCTLSSGGLTSLRAAATFCLAVTAVLAALRPTAADEFDRARLGEIRAAMQRFVDSGEIAGAVTVVGRRDGVASLEAVGYRDVDAQQPMQPDCLFRIASMTKPVTAIGIMILADEGKLSVDDAVEKYVPALANLKLRAGGGTDGPKLVAPPRPIKLRDLLTHTSGLPGGVPPDLYTKRDRTLAEAVPTFADRPLDFAPGTKWQYCNIGMDTLGRVIEIVSGQPYEKFLQQRVFDRLGMKDTCFYPTAAQKARVAVTYDRKDGKLVASQHDIIGLPPEAKYPIPAGGLYSTAADLARLYRMMLGQGTLDGQRILSPQAVTAMTMLQTGDITCGFVPGMGFGFGWAVVRQPQGITAMLSPGTFGHGGAFGTQGWIDPHRNLFVVLLIQRVGLPNADGSEMRRQLQTIAAAALERKPAK